ncbi:MAG: hypothetical protein SVM79_06430 [Chloroflexota bacterium]|nr:hypothetical protein [Chloroflexota bacterium]
MGKKSYQSQSRYAKTGSQPKKKHPQRPRTPEGAPVQTNMTVAAAQAAPVPRTRDQVSAATPMYNYIITDLKQTGIIAAALFILLIILFIALG